MKQSAQYRHLRLDLVRRSYRSKRKIRILGALVAGFVSGYLILLLRKLCDKLPDALEKIAPVLIYPVAGILGIGLLMNFAIEPVMGAINTALEQRTDRNGWLKQACAWSDPLAE